MLQSDLSNKRHLLRRALSNKWIWLVLIVVLGGLAWHFFRDKSAQGGPGDFAGRRNNASVAFASAEVADIPIVLNALGTVTATATATVRPQVSGVLQQVNFQEGQMVKAGQILATIDPRPFELALMQATGQRQRDEAQLDNARVILTRNKILQSQDSIAQQEVEAQAALVKQLEGTVMSDRAQEGTAQLNLSYTKVVAPVSGRLGLRTADIGNLVSSGDTNGIATITQIAPIDVEFSVPQNQVADVQAGLYEAFEDEAQPNSESHKADTAKPANPKHEDVKMTALKVMVFDRSRTNMLATGDFLALDNQMDIQTGTVKAKARFANEKRQLFPNEFVNIKMILRQVKGAVVIPVASLRHSNKGDFVYILNMEDQTVSQRTVTAGQADVDKVQIISGLQVGEKVITEGADRLKDGAKVNLPSNAPMEANGGGKPDWKNRLWKGKDAAGMNGAKREWPKKSAENADAPAVAAGESSSSASSHAGEHERKRPRDAN